MSILVEDVVDAAGARAPRRAATTTAVIVLAAIVGTVASVLLVQAFGYPPCELCLKERLPFYLGIALAAVTIPLAARAPRGIALAAFVLLAALFLASAGLGAYHAGVEWGFWPGPAECTGAGDRAATSADFLRQLRDVRVVRCDAAALRVLGVSLAGWNAVGSLAIAALAAFGATRLRRS